MKELNNKDKEKMLLTGKSLEELIEMKIQEEYKSVMNTPLPSIKKVTDCSQLKEKDIFSKNATFKVFNKTTRMESFINGVQAEGMIGLQPNVREALLAGKIRAFISGENYVEFLYSKVI